MNTLIKYTFHCLLICGLAITVSAQHDHEDHADDGHDEHTDLGQDEGHDDHDDDGVQDEHDDHDEDMVEISDEVLKEFGVKLGTVEHGVLQEEIILPGEIKFNRETLAYATPRFAGTVLDIRARLSFEVKQGDLLASMERTENLRPFEVTAPLNGTVVAYDITPGQTFEAGSPLFTIADLSTVWADLRIYMRDITKVHKGQRVVIDGGNDLPTFLGTIGYIAPTIDEHTRTGLARIIIDNTSGKWKPGQFIKGRVEINEEHADLIIPRSAILTHEGEQVVFIKTDEGFEPRHVTLGHNDAVSFELLGGLKEGDIIAIENPLSLKAELGKASFGGHEGHVH